MYCISRVENIAKMQRKSNTGFSNGDTFLWGFPPKLFQPGIKGLPSPPFPPLFLPSKKNPLGAKFSAFRTLAKKT